MLRATHTFETLQDSSSMESEQRASCTTSVPTLKSYKSMLSHSPCSFHTCVATATTELRRSKKSRVICSKQRNSATGRLLPAADNASERNVCNTRRSFKSIVGVRHLRQNCNVFAFSQPDNQRTAPLPKIQRFSLSCYPSACFRQSSEANGPYNLKVVAHASACSH